MTHFSDEPTLTQDTLARRYSDEDVEAILKKAVTLRETYNREQLATLAAELNVSARELAIAESLWLAERDKQARSAFMGERQQSAWTRMAWWAGVGLLIILAFISRVALFVQFSRFAAIPYIVVLVVLIVLLIQTYAQRSGDGFDIAYEKWLVKQKERRARDERRKELLS
jgi:cobalamin synthase